jgi:hypothetical protein
MSQELGSFFLNYEYTTAAQNAVAMPAVLSLPWVVESTLSEWEIII